MTKKIIVRAVIAVVTIAAITAVVTIPKQSPHTNVTVQDRLMACGSLPPGSTENATETSRMFINLPKDIYPDINLKITSYGATANYVSDGGQYGYALGSQGKSNCWSYYFEFDLASSSQGSGSVDIGSKSGARGTPDYLIHIKVTVASKSVPVSTSTSQGTIYGQVLLGPTCPVERIPPDPNCAPRPYQTIIAAFRTADTSTPYITTKSDASGTFALSLDSGTYILRVESSAVYPRCLDMPVQVIMGKYQNVIINCDTGIR